VNLSKLDVQITEGIDRDDVAFIFRFTKVFPRQFFKYELAALKLDSIELDAVGYHHIATELYESTLSPQIDRMNPVSACATARNTIHFGRCQGDA
jgi:hypothetical protein